MGQACAGLLQRVMNVEVFEKRQAGPTLRKFFGAYRQPDFWAVYRRFRAIDDGNGYVSYDELLKVVSLEEYQLLFLWETFSQQNNVMDARELMTLICTFSSAPLIEKGKFLQALFDESRTGLNTASELVTMFHMVLSVFTKCTGVPIKVKDVRDQLKRVLPDLLPETWAEAMERQQGKSEAAFNNDRCIGQIEMEQLVPSIRECYETLPVAGPVPPGACNPPPPDWAVPSSLERGQAKIASSEPQAKATGPSAKKLSKDELAHLEWMAQLEDDEEGTANRPSPKETAKSEEVSGPPARGWMVIYGSEFSTVAKNLHAFKLLFIRSVASALGVPMGSVEVVNVFRGSVVIEFLLHPSGRGTDTRDGETLKQALAQQLSLSHSALRKGPFKEYCTTAELVERPAKLDRTKRASDTASTSQAGTTAAGQRRDQAIQTEPPEKDLDDPMQEVLRDLEAAEAEARLWKQRAEEAMAERDKALGKDPTSS